MDVVEIEVVNWERYNPRTDRKSSAWFRLENSIATEPKFFGLSCAQKFIAICIFAEASKKCGAKAKIHVDWLSDQLKIDASEIRQTIQHLVGGGVVVVSSGVAAVSSGCPTYERTNVRTPKPPAGAGAFSFEAEFKEFSEKYTELFPGAVVGGKAKDRFCLQIRSIEEVDQLSAAMKNYRTLLDAEGWRKPKTSFENFLGTKRSGFFWRDYIKPVKLVKAGGTLGGFLEV